MPKVLYNFLFEPLRALGAIVFLCSFFLCSSTYAQNSRPAFTWTNQNLTTASSIRSVDTQDLRDKLDIIGAGSCPVTHPTWSAGLATGQPVRAQFITELRTYVNALYTAAGRTPPVFTDAQIVTPGTDPNCTANNTCTPIRAIHITELRTAIESASCCGNGFCESSQGETGGNCPQDCEVCGNGIANPAAGEQCDCIGSCDASELNNQTCVLQGFTGGTLGCNSNCTFNTSQCSNCGNGVVSGAEQCDCIGSCDASELNNKTCVTQGFTGGTLGCKSDCTFDTSNCINPANCGNGVINVGEQCDGSNLNSQNCSSRGFFTGTLSCNPNCSFNTSQCTNCGNDNIDGSEQCDGNALGGQSCGSQGFDGGNLSCNSDCTLNTSSCYTCGDGVKNSSEQCDGSALGGASCSSRGFDGGTLSCNSNCTFNTSSCYKCGDGVKNGSEDCDGSALGGQTCGSQGFDGGTLSCKSNCTFNTSSCFGCGDGVKNGNEQCDGSALGGASCSSRGFSGGTLSCNSNCTFNTSSCCSSVNGGWTNWSTPCTSGSQTRTCTNPTPSCGGSSCSGNSSQSCCSAQCNYTETTQSSINGYCGCTGGAQGPSSLSCHAGQGNGGCEWSNFWDGSSCRGPYCDGCSCQITCYQCQDKGEGSCAVASSTFSGSCPSGWSSTSPSCQTCWTVSKTGVHAADLWDDDERCGGDDICDPWNHCAPPPYFMCAKQGCAFSGWCGPYSASDWSQSTASSNATSAVIANCSNCDNCLNCCPKKIGEKATTGYLCDSSMWTVTSSYTCQTDGTCP